MINEKTYKFQRIDRLHFLRYCLPDDDISNYKILDYGGNHGNLLKDGMAEGVIRPENYTCVDVDFYVIKEAKVEHPEATWMYYNRHNQCYNPEGEKMIPLPFNDNTFDLAYVYSVHTHCSYEDFVFDLKELRRVAKKVLISYCDKELVKWVSMKRRFDYTEIHPDWDDPGSIESYRYYVDNDISTTNPDEIKNDCDYLVTAYDTDWLVSQHPEITRTIPTMAMTNKIHGITQPFLVIDG